MATTPTTVSDGVTLPAQINSSPTYTSPTNTISAPLTSASSGSPSTTGVNTNTNTTNTSTAGTGGLYPNINIPAYNQAVLDKLNATISGANATYNTAQQYLPTQQAQAQAEANAAINSANTSAAGRIGTDTQNITNTNAERNLALQQLADQLHGQYQGLMNQLGSVGAGNSSAALMGTNALGHEGQISTANANMQADTSNAAQNADIQATQKNRDAYIAQQNAALNATLGNIQNQFITLLNGLKTQIGEATPEAQQSLAYFGGVLSQAAQLASQQAQQSYLNSIAPVAQAQMNDASTAQSNLASSQDAVNQFMQQNGSAGVNGTNIGQYNPGTSVAPISITSPTISPFAPASTGNVAAGQNTPSAFSAQNSQTAQPNGDVISYLNSLLSSAPGQPTSNANGG